MANLANHFQGPLAVRLGYDTERLAAVCERLARAVMQDMRRAVGAEALGGLGFCEVVLEIAAQERLEPQLAPRR